MRLKRLILPERVSVILTKASCLEDILMGLKINHKGFLYDNTFDVVNLMLQLERMWYISRRESSHQEYNDALVNISIAIFKFLPTTITHVSMCHYTLNFIDKDWCKDRTGQYLSAWEKIFKQIPPSVHSIDLSRNFDLFKGMKTRALMKRIGRLLNSIPDTVTSVDFRFNGLFNNKTPAKIDALLYIKQGKYAGQIDFSYNGEQDFTRAICPMLSLVKQGLLPREIAYRVLWELKPEVPNIQRFINSRLAKIVTSKASFFDPSLIGESYSNYGGGFLRSIELGISSDQKKLDKLREWHKADQDEAAGQSLKHFCLT